MTKIESKHLRILGIALSTRGFGFAVLEGQATLVDWGVKSIKGDKNIGSIKKAKEAILHYQPGVIVLEDALSKTSRRSDRIQELHQEIIALAKSLNVKVAVFKREQVRRMFFAEGLGTKYALAEMLAARYPEELASRLPPKRRLWMSEDYRMDIFDAVALALTLPLKKSLSKTLTGHSTSIRESMD